MTHGMRPSTRKQMPDDMMRTPPPPGFLLAKKTDKIDYGDMVMTSNVPGDWRTVDADLTLIIGGMTPDRVSQKFDVQVKLAKRKK